MSFFSIPPRVHTQETNCDTAAISELTMRFSASLKISIEVQRYDRHSIDHDLNTDYDSDPMSLDTSERTPTSSISEPVTLCQSSSSSSCTGCWTQDQEPPQTPNSMPDDNENDDYYTEQCPICHERLYTEPPLTNCQQCFNGYHLACMEEWAEHCLTDTFTLVTCPLCRVEWHDQFLHLLNHGSTDQFFDYNGDLNTEFFGEARLPGHRRMTSAELRYEIYAQERGEFDESEGEYSDVEDYVIYRGANEVRWTSDVVGRLRGG